jgi:hypothetical protein
VKAITPPPLPVSGGKGVGVSTGRGVSVGRGVAVCVGMEVAVSVGGSGVFVAGTGVAVRVGGTAVAVAAACSAAAVVLVGAAFSAHVATAKSIVSRTVKMVIFRPIVSLLPVDQLYNSGWIRWKPVAS